MAHLRLIRGNEKSYAEILVQALQVVLFVMALAAAAFAQGSSADAAQQDGLFSMLFSGYGIGVLLVLVLVGLIIVRKVRRKKNTDWEEVEQEPAKPVPQPRNEIAPPKNQMRRAEDQAALQARQSSEPGPAPATDSSSGFGAYRVDQEVSKLIIGKSHRMDVIASRAPDDRRAIEASLIKALNAFDTDDEGKLRARDALQEYGFLARQSATLLMGRDAWERSSAARMLGEVGSAASLPFLIEALHDPDVVVRNQAVASLGHLKLPTAIGSLLDIAKLHPDIPAPLLSEALSACSVDSLSFLDVPSDEPAHTAEHNLHEEGSKIHSFAEFDNLPEESSDPALADALNQIDDDDVRVRAQSAQLLGLHAVQSSVSALTSLALDDNDSSVRAAAVSSLGSIDHESVFSSVLIALSDESREVRAAAARVLTSLRFDRGDAYVHLTETADKDTLRRVAQACVKIGIVTQALDRLNCEDRRQAHEAFSLFSLLAKAHETDPIIRALETHPEENVRLALARVLNVAAPPELGPKLRELVASGKISENLRTALLEVLYRLDQSQTKENIQSSDNVIGDVA